ncbi:MAG: YtxH domain-containing protein [Myxococcota bacterium]|nr:YtxH domain-containing protein [Myxococcota bacterium]
MIDVTKTIALIAAAPEVRKLMGSLREKKVGDYLALLGLYPTARMMVVPGIGIFAAGAVVGAATAVLVTPRTGEALRADISDLLRSLRARVESSEVEENGESKPRASRRASSTAS